MYQYGGVLPGLSYPKYRDRSRYPNHAYANSMENECTITRQSGYSGYLSYCIAVSPTTKLVRVT